MKKKMTTATVALVLALTGCSSSSGQGAAEGEPNQEGAPSSTKIDGVRFRVPPRIVSQDGGEMVVESGVSGPAKVYVYVADDKLGAPDCTDASVNPHDVTLVEGEQSVHLYGGAVGEATVVVIGDGFGTKCGELKTRYVLRPKLSSFVESDDLEKTAKVGKPFRVGIDTYEPPKQLGALPVKLDLIGPWASVPEAEQAGCEGPVASSATLTVTEGSLTKGKMKTDMTAPEAGVYKLVASAQQTDWTEAVTSRCDAVIAVK